MNFLKHKLLLIGASTGGPGLIEKIITSLGQKIEGSIIIAQHMDKIAIASFAKRLNRINKTIEVVFCETSCENINNNTIYLLNDTARLEQRNGLTLQKINDFQGIYHPNIDELFFSASKIINYDIQAYLLSGIGSDGAKGLKALKDAGYYCVAQDEKTSIVYGMPKRAKEINAVSSVLCIEKIIKEINVFLA